MSRPRKTRWISALVVVVALAAASPAGAQQRDDASPEKADRSDGKTDEKATNPAYERAFEKGREAYNAEKYARAVEHYVDAIQAAPEKPEPYLNLARTLFWKGTYARAVVYYDHYLTLSESPKNAEKIKRERKLAAQRTGGEVWNPPDSQRRVLEALRDKLTDGRAFTEGGGGAWALFKTLLRTGYAHPDLSRVQTRLRKKLVAEFEGLVVPEADQPVPVLSLEEWKRQRRRLEAARSLSRDEEVAEIVGRRMTMVDAAVALLNSRHEDAVELTKRALDENPDMGFLRWFRISALVQAESYERARKAIATYEKSLGDDSTAERKYLRVMEAIVADRAGETDKAAEAYFEVLD